MFTDSIIITAEYLPQSLPLHVDFRISRGALVAADSVFIRLTDEHGVCGLGEAAPFPTLTGDTQAIVCDVAGQYLKQIVGLKPASVLERVHGDWRKKLYALSPSFLAGLELAVLDLRARQSSIPLHAYFGEVGQLHQLTDITLPIMPAEDVGGFWNLYSGCGFRAVKVKVGGQSSGQDADRIEELYRLLPAGTKLSLDGNQGCTVTSSLDLLAALRNRGIVPFCFEQPLPESDFTGMTELTAKSPVSICADELVKTVDDARRVVRERAAHMINLKFMKSGVAESAAIASIAKSAGLGLMIGGMVETEVGMTASLHFAAGTGLIDWLDLDTPFFIANRVTASSPYHPGQAQLVCPSSPGLGLELVPSR
jgi:L-alanine-DL-glutamate epimerase-like enolase superfamily enzyme